jgi:hypothetical protein
MAAEEDSDDGPGREFTSGAATEWRPSRLTVVMLKDA